MAEDLATLSLKLSNEKAIADAKATGAAYEEMGVKGEAAAKRIAAASNPVTDAIKGQAAASVAATKGMGTWAALQAEATGHVGEHSLAIGRLERAFASIVGHTLGANSAVELLGSGLLKFAIGSLETAGILGGLALLAVAYDKLTEGSRKAKEETDKLIDSLTKAIALKAAGPGGETVEQVAAAASQANVLLAERYRLNQGLLLKPREGESPMMTQSLVAAQAIARRRLDEIATELSNLRAVEAGGQSIINEKTGAAIKSENDERLAALKKITEEQKHYNDAITQATAETNKLNLEQAKKTIGIETDRNNADLLLAAAKLGTQEYNDQVDAIAVQNKLAQDGIYWFDARYDAAKRNLEVTVAERRETETILKARADDTTRAKELAAKAAEEAQRLFKNMIRELQTEFATFFDNIFTKGIKSFGDLVSAIKDMFLKMIAELIAANMMKRLAPILGGMMGLPMAAGAQGAGTGGTGGMLSGLGMQMAGQAAMGGLAGGAVGYAVGQQVGSAGGGAVLGAASGAATGFAVAGPLGALAGGITGLIGGMLGGAAAAREAAAAMRQMQKDYTAALMAFKHDDLGAALAQNAAQAEALRQTAAKIYNTVFGVIQDIRNGTNKYRDALADINAQEAQNAAMIQRQAAQKPEDYQVRLLRAQGQDAQANALQLQHDQARERQALIDSFGAVIDPTEAATLALLDQTQAQEKLKAATDAANSSALNMVSGYRLQATIFSAMNARNPGAAIFPAVNPLGPSTGTGLHPPGQVSGDLHVTVMTPNGSVLGTAVLKDFRGRAQRNFGDSTKWSQVQS